MLVLCLLLALTATIANAIQFENGLESKGTVYDDPLFTNLKTWADALERKGKGFYYSPKLAVGTFESLDPEGKPVMVRGLMALEDIEVDENLVSAPLSFVFNSGPQMKSSRWNVIFEDNEHWDLYKKTVLYMLLENDRNPQEWAPYLDIWRKAPIQDMSVFWSAEQLSKHNKHLQRITMDRIAELRFHYEEIFPRIFDQYPQFFKNRENFSYEKWVWAATISISRTFEFDVNGEDVVMLIPFADLLNHRQLPLEADVEIDYKANSGAVEVNALRHISKGSRLCCNYGPECAEEFILFHGFALPTMKSCEPEVATLYEMEQKYSKLEKQLDDIKQLLQQQQQGGAKLKETHVHN